METRRLSECLEATHGIIHANLFQFSPIFRLPPELLTTIFVYLRRVSINAYPSDRKGSCAPWMVVTEVCRHWRDIAHESVILWSRIPCYYSRPIIRKCLKLSRSAPLVFIHGCRSSDEIHPSLKDPAVVSRLRCLDVDMSVPNSSLQESCFLLSSGAPLLESLAINLNRYHLQNEPRYLDNLWARTMPRLRNLSFRECEVNLTSPLLTDLTILEIRNPQPKLNGMEFLSALRGLPSLISLRVASLFQLPEDYQVNPNYTPISAQELPVVELPSVKVLSIYGSCYAQDLDLLSRLSFPPTTILLFSSGYPFHHRSPIAAVSDFLQVHASARLYFGAFTPTKVELMTFFGRLKLNLMYDQKTLCAFKLDSGGDTRYQRHEITSGPDLDEILSYLSFPTLSYFSTSCYVVPSAWPGISSRLPGLKHLSIEGICRLEVETLFETLIDDSQTRSLGSWTPIFPSLRTLHLQDIAVDDKFKENLVQALRDRKEAGSGLEKIGVDGCDRIEDAFLDSLGVVEGLTATRCVCDDLSEDERDLYNQFAEELDEGEISRSDVNLWYYVHSYMQDVDM
ncbi:hypothetical protein BDN72DRAFT_879332 [Pluteus cervinus]|uniref:Uncharacterized protein n=1 Tax=Pluteus cervinus TaxID=181527 RepID=A0ACD3AR04_9AGAR|nr:hypothetical protein BDN72DRAFT_879332 [Pluteus cervinus]